MLLAWGLLQRAPTGIPLVGHFSAPVTAAPGGGGLSPEGLTAIATFALALVTVGAVITPIVQRFNDRVLRSRAALRQLHFFLLVYGRRLNEIAIDPRWQPDILLRDLDVILGAVLSTEFFQALPTTLPVSEAILALVNAHVTLVLGVQQYHDDKQGPYFVQGQAQKARERIKRASKALFIPNARIELQAMRLIPYCFRRVEMASPEDVQKLLDD